MAIFNSYVKKNHVFFCCLAGGFPLEKNYRIKLSMQGCLGFFSDEMRVFFWRSPWEDPFFCTMGCDVICGGIWVWYKIGYTGNII